MIKSHLPAGGLADYLFSFSTANGKLDKSLPGELMWNINGETSSELRILTAKRGDQTWKGCWIILGIFFYGLHQNQRAVKVKTLFLLSFTTHQLYV